MCRICKRQVFDLSDMDDEERAAFLSACSGEICVSYKLPASRAIAAALAIAAVVAPVAASAQDASNLEEIVVTAGGIKDLANIEYIQDAGDAAIPDLPVVDDEASTASGAAAGHDGK